MAIGARATHRLPVMLAGMTLPKTRGASDKAAAGKVVQPLPTDDAPRP